MAFNPMMSDTSNQIQSYNIPVSPSGVGAIASLTENVIAPIALEVKRQNDVAKVNDLSNDMEKEYLNLVEQRRQGKIKSNSELFLKLNTRSKQLSADFPEIADKFKARIQQDFGGNLMEQAVKADLTPLEMEEQLNNTLFTEAQQYDLTVNDKSGKVDRDASINLMKSIKKKKFLAELASNDGDEQEFGHNINTAYSESQKKARSDLQTIADDKTLTDAQKYAAADEYLNAFHARFNNEILVPSIASTKLKGTQIATIQSNIENWQKSFREYVIGDKTGSLTSKIRQAEVTTKFDVAQAAPALRKLRVISATLGDNSASTILNQAFMSDQGALAKSALTKGISGELGDLSNTTYSPYNVVNATDKVLSGQVNTDNAMSMLEPMEQKALVSGIYNTVQKDLPDYVNKLKTGGVTNPVEKTQTWLRASDSLISIADSSTTTSDKAKLLNVLNQPSTFDLYDQAIQQGHKDAVISTADKIRGVSSKFIQSQWGWGESALNREVGNIVYNSATGKLEYEADESKMSNIAKIAGKGAEKLGGDLSTVYRVEKGISDFQRKRSTVNARDDKVLKGYNDALDVYVKSLALITGDRNVNKTAVKQFIASQYGYPTKGIDYKEKGLNDELKWWMTNDLGIGKPRTEPPALDSTTNVLTDGK